MKYSITVLIVLLAALSANCQNKYQEAYIVNNNGDTLKGYVNCKEWSNTPVAFRFRSSASSDIMDCTIANTQYVWIKDVDSFRRFDATVSMGRADAAEQRNTPDTATIDTTIFMKVLATGSRVNLYAFSDNIKTRYFITWNDTIEELVYAKYFFYDKLVTFEKYKTQLLNVALHYQSNTRSFIQILQTAKYTVSPIMKAVAYINGKEYRRRSRTAIRPYAGMSADFSFSRYKGTTPFPTAPYYSSPEENKPCYSVKAAVGLDFVFNPIIKKSVFRIDLGFLPAKYETTKWKEGHNGYVRISFNQYTFSLTPQLIYNICNSESLRWNLGIGLAVDCSFYNKELWEQRYNADTGNVHDYPLATRKFWMSLPLRTGLIIANRFDVYLQYSHPLSAIERYTNYDIKIYSFQLGINYLF